MGLWLYVLDPEPPVEEDSKPSLSREIAHRHGLLTTFDFETTKQKCALFISKKLGLGREAGNNPECKECNADVEGAFEDETEMLAIFISTVQAYLHPSP